MRYINRLFTYLLKALLVTSLTHVSGAIASVQTFTFLPFTYLILRLYVTGNGAT